MAGKKTGTGGKGKGGKGKGGKGNTNAKYLADTVAVILKRDCAEQLYNALVIALGTLPRPKKGKKKGKGKGKGKTGGGGKGGSGKGGGGKGGGKS